MSTLLKMPFRMKYNWTCTIAMCILYWACAHLFGVIIGYVIVPFIADAYWSMIAEHIILFVTGFSAGWFLIGPEVVKGFLLSQGKRAMKRINTFMEVNPEFHDKLIEEMSKHSRKDS